MCMSELNIQVCPETGICSIIRGDGKKVDLMPDEVSQLKESSGNPEAIRQALAQVDSGFTESLGAQEIDQISAELK